LKPETANALQYAKEHLAKAQKIADIGIASVAGREAYIAALSAARALTFELRGKGPKTHKGVRALMHEIVRDGVEISPTLLMILSRGFELKIQADYGDPRKVTAEEARQAIAMASDLIAQIERLLTGTS